MSCIPVIGAGGAEGSIDASNILKPALARGEIQVIGATTLDEYQKYIEKDAALERRFASVHVNEPSADDTVEILKGLRKRYEATTVWKSLTQRLKQPFNYRFVILRLVNYPIKPSI